jgi:hypothetical protein
MENIGNRLSDKYRTLIKNLKVLMEIVLEYAI